MSEPVAVPISAEAIKEALGSSPSVEPVDEGVYLDDMTMNHLSYKATNSVPYIIDYFGINDFYETNPQITEMAKELHEILVLDDSGTTVNETKQELDALLQELNLSENDAPIYKLKQALFLAKIRNEQQSLNSKKLQALADSVKV